MSALVVVEEEEEPKILFTSEPSPQNKSCSKCQQIVRNIFFGMSVCQNVRMQLFSLGIKMKVQNVIRMSASHYVIMSIRQYVSMSICQYVSNVYEEEPVGARGDRPSN